MARVKADILVSAALRYANEAMIDCVLQHRGDADAGAIYVHIDALDGRHQIVDIDRRQTGPRLIKKQHFRPHRDGAAKRQQAALPARKFSCRNLGVIGQTRGVSILAVSEAPILAAASSYARLGLDDLGSATIIADTLSMRHEIQYSRLFQS